MPEPHDLTPNPAGSPQPFEVAPVEPSASSESSEPTIAQNTLFESGNENQQVSFATRQSMTEGNLLGLYQIVRKLGQGGMGARL
jgi:hypothetical protein